MPETQANPTPARKRILSGIQPTGTPTLGNYLGALRNWALLQDSYELPVHGRRPARADPCARNPPRCAAHTRELAALLLAVGIDPNEHVLFVQSHVPAHTELSWILACNTQFGELSPHDAVQGQERQTPRQRQRRPVHLPGADGRRYPDL